MKNWICLSSVWLLILFAAESSFAQQASASPTTDRIVRVDSQLCPTISVSCPSFLEAGKPIEFTSSIAGGNPKALLTYTWEVYGGVLTEGQGTPAIKVSAAIPGPTVGAILRVGGLDSMCAATASCSNSNCVQVPPVAVKLDSSGVTSLGQDEARLNRVAGGPPSASAAPQDKMVIYERCPTISVSCPSDVEVGKPLEFLSSMSSLDPGAKRTYTWEVVGGELAEGQGTPTIRVKKTAPPGKGVTATLHVGGLDLMCPAIASCSTASYQVPLAEKFDSYVSVPLNNEKPLLSLLAAVLKQRPGVQGYILGYGGLQSRSVAAQKAVDRAKQYLVNELGMDERRFVTVNAGLKKEPTVELWLVPMGATPPATDPPAEPTGVNQIKTTRNTSTKSRLKH